MLLLGLFCATVLVLVGVGLGTVGTAVISMSKLAEMQKQAGARGAQAARGVQGAAVPPGEGQGGATAAGEALEGSSGKGASVGVAAAEGSGRSSGEGAAPAGPGPRGPRPALGVEAVDAPGRDGAQLTGVRRPGPGDAAGLVRGDVLLAFGGTRVRSAGDLAKAVATARPGRTVSLTVRHASGTRQTLTVKPGLVT
ncbi:PDZ domain-containing protein [Streptomyces typhae]